MKITTEAAITKKPPIYKESAPVDFDPFAAAPDLVATAPSTEPQREIWVAASLGTEASLAYNQSVCLHLEGGLDAGCLERALTQLVERHEALRASFGPDGQTLCVARAIPLQTGAVDAGTEQNLDAWRRHEIITPFDLVNGPLFRCRVVRLDESRHAVLLTAHHTVCDGWSFGVLVTELAALYNAGLRDETPALAPAPGFCEYAIAQADIDAATLHAQEAWWSECLRDAPARIELPADHARPNTRSFAAGYRQHRVPHDIMTRLRARGAARGCTGFSVLAAAVLAYLHRLTGQQDLIIGVPAAGQASEGLHGLVGHCVSLLPVRSRLDARTGFDAHLDAVAESLADAWEHRDCSMGRIVRRLGLPRDPAVVPLVQVILNVDRRTETPAFDGLRAYYDDTPRAFENFEMFINAIDNGDDGLLIECTYDANLFADASIGHRLQELECFIDRLCDSGGAIAGMDIVTPAEHSQLLTWSRDASRDWPAATVDALIRAQCAQHPDAIASSDAGGQLTYAALQAHAARVTTALRAHGIGRGDIVGVLAERDAQLPALLLGILESGAAYLPLDPETPPERLHWMLDDANVPLVLVHRPDSAARDALTAFGGRVVDVETLSPSSAWQGKTAPAPEDPPATATSTTRSLNQLPNQLPNPAGNHSPQDPAYVIYTSGSTGKPKGVIVPHGAVANFLRAMHETLSLSANDRFIALTTLSFDIAVLELLLPLTLGACTEIVPRDIARDGDALRERLAICRPTVMQATPATWQLLLSAGWNGDPTLTALSGGEALPAPLARALLENHRAVWNLYGPTETTVWSCAHRVRASDDPVPIGKPIANTQVCVLDAAGRPTPPGVPGELYIGGDGVTLGYLDRPALTKERFVTRNGEMLYRTGDRVRFRADGTLAYLGRVDFQIKLRGHRIEPGEIESVIESHPAVKRAVVVVRDFGTGSDSGSTVSDQRLVAYLVLHEQARVAIDALRAHLKRQLPAHMLPQHIVELDTLPLTPSGKIDRQALPSPVALPRATPMPPRTGTEQRIAAIWCDILGIDAVSITDNFFDLGGHSLSSMKVIARIDAELGRRLRPRLMVLNTLAEIAAACENAPVVSSRDARADSREDIARSGMWKSVMNALLRR